MIPSAHISSLVLLENSLPNKTSGGKYNSVPALIDSFWFPFEHPEIPKSMIII